MSTAAPAPPAPPQDQASRLRSMVQSMYGPGVNLVTFVERNGPAPQKVEIPVSTRIAKAPPRAVKHCPVVAVTSGKGGVGKTSICVNLAIALAARKHRATLLDADLGLANADVLCGMAPTTRLDSAIALRARDPKSRTLSQISVQAPGGFQLVPGSVGVARMANLTEEQRRTMLDGLLDLARESDVVLIDTRARLSDGVTSFVAAADAAVVVVTPEPTSIADAYAMIKCVVTGRPPGAPAPRIGLIVNEAATKAEGDGVYGRITATAKKFLSLEPTHLGVLHLDDAMPAAVR